MKRAMNMRHTKNQVNELYKLFDPNGTTMITGAHLHKLSKEIGCELSSFQIHKIIQNCSESRHHITQGEFFDIVTRSSRKDNFRGRIKQPIKLDKEITVLDDDDESVASQEQIVKPTFSPDHLALSRKPTAVGSKASHSQNSVSDISPDSSPPSHKKKAFARGGWFTEECLKEPDEETNSRASYLS